jgi:fructokinase
MRIGVDLGGTKVEAVVVRTEADGSYEELDRMRLPTPREQGYEAVLETVASVVQRMAARTRVPFEALPIGVGMPGGVRRDGCVKNSNTTCLNGRPFRQDLEARLGRKLVFDNDANCFALAEARFGAGAPWRSGVVFGVILGTGVGGGIVCEGTVWRGPQGIAGEWGHHVVWSGTPEAPGAPRACYCGKTGCVEAYVSGPAVEADYHRRAGKALNMRGIVASAGTDPHASAAFDLFLETLARGLANVINVLDPSAIVLGGGLSNIDRIYEEGPSRVARYVFNEHLSTPILRNRLGDSAGVIGAALLTMHSRG